MPRRIVADRARCGGERPAQRHRRCWLNLSNCSRCDSDRGKHMESSNNTHTPPHTERRVRLRLPAWRSVSQAPLLSLARKLYKRLRPYRWIFAIAVTQVILMGALELLKPWP